MQLLVFLSFQVQRGREERRRSGFSVALNIFLYCEKCSMFMCLHVNQGGEMNNRVLVIGSIRRTCSFLFQSDATAADCTDELVLSNPNKRVDSSVSDSRRPFRWFSERFSFPRA